jgi:DNA-binding NtrC family response regulator
MPGESDDPALPEIIGESPVLQSVLRQALSAAKGDSVVLVSGEKRTGKELIARAIHRMGSRRSQSLVKVDCSKLAPAQLEAALFGPDSGRIKAAHRGTLLLSHVESVARELQLRLLSALEQKEHERPAGATATIDTRLMLTVSDTEQRLEDFWLRENLSPDLNLSIINIKIPALRDRRADIPLLAWHFVRKWARLMNKPVEVISDATMNLLMSYSWPANIRELESVIERAVRSSKNADLQPELPNSGD